METKEFKKGVKIGYLNPKTGRYMWGEVISIAPHSKTGETAVQIETILRQGRKTWRQVHEDEMANLLRWSTEQSIDWKTPKTCVKIKF